MHLHAHWYQPRESPQVPNSDVRFRQRFGEAWLAAAHVAQTAPHNVDSHLWTDRRNLMALLTPVPKHNGAELEIPHSMVARSPLQVHFEPALDEAVERVPQASVRDALYKCLHHPVMANMGAKTDISRLVYLNAYQTNIPSEVNVHADIDVLRDTHDIAAVEHLTAEESEDAKQAGQGSIQLRMAKAVMRGIDKEMRSLTLPPEPGALDQEGLKRLASRPQRNWSVRAPAKMPTRGGAPIRSDVKHRGTTGYLEEAGYLLGIPGHPISGDIAKTVFEGLSTGTLDCTPPGAKLGFGPSEGLAHLMRDRLLLSLEDSRDRLRSLIRGTQVSGESIDQAKMVDLFRLCERIHSATPMLNAKREEILQAIEVQGRTAELAMKLQALAQIRLAAGLFSYSFVNAHTYMPLMIATPVGSQESQQVQGLMDMGRAIFGIEPILDPSEHTWVRGMDKTQQEESKAPAGQDTGDYLRHAARLFTEIKAMLEPTATESGGGVRVR